MTDIDFYIKKIKEHESQRLSTNERNEFWRQYNENTRIAK